MRAAAALVPFTPTAVDPDVLDRRTVARQDLLDRLVKAARQAASSGERRHSLLVAPRGGGKTHVLTVFAHRVRCDAKLAARLALVVIPEDAIDISSYEDLLVAVTDDLGAVSYTHLTLPTTPYV